MQEFIHSLRTLIRREDGATMVEYGMMVALIAVVCLLAVTALGTAKGGMGAGDLKLMAGVARHTGHFARAHHQRPGNRLLFSRTDAAKSLANGSHLYRHRWRRQRLCTGRLSGSVWGVLAGTLPFLEWPDGGNSIQQRVRFTVSTTYQPLLTTVFSSSTYTHSAASTMPIAH